MARRTILTPAAYSWIGISAVIASVFIIGLAVGSDHGHSRSADVARVSDTPTMVAAAQTGQATMNVAPASSPGSATESSQAPAALTAPTTSPSTTATAAPTEVTYIVKPGDNLTVIAAWFHQHGYLPLYDWNKTAIGQNPNLIRPGQVLVVAVQP
jgi:nucleoid-associated protein YgaU